MKTPVSAGRPAYFGINSFNHEKKWKKIEGKTGTERKIIGYKNRSGKKGRKECENFIRWIRLVRVNKMSLNSRSSWNICK